MRGQCWDSMGRWVPVQRRRRQPMRNLFGILLGLLWMGVLVGMGGCVETPPPSPRTMMVGENGWTVTALLTVGARLPSRDARFGPGGYQPVGLLDGLGARRMPNGLLRLFVNHELHRSSGYPYRLRNGTELTGARISVLDVDPGTQAVVNGGLAYWDIVDRRGRIVESAEQVNETGKTPDGLFRLCSATLIEAGTRGFVDTLLLTGEEAVDPIDHPHGGTLWALDVQTETLFAVPAVGRMAFENAVPLSVEGGRVALVIGDDTPPQSDEPEAFGHEATESTPIDHVVSAPLWLYIGKKKAGWVRRDLPAKSGQAELEVLARNGLLEGDLYYFVADHGISTVNQWHGTGVGLTGSWRKIEVRDPSKARQPGYDALGYKHGFTLRREAKAGGAFQFVRPEDVSPHPVKKGRVAFAATGRWSVYGGQDGWGTVYQADIDLTAMKATMTILYDGDDGGTGDPDDGIRNPDNLEWGRDGYLYVQEDNAKGGPPYFGSRSGEEAKIWRLDPNTGTIQVIARMDRTAVWPAGSTDGRPETIGLWESSGLLEVSSLVGATRSDPVFVFTVQAHTVMDGPIQQHRLVEGGQLLWLSRRMAGETD